LKLQITVNGQAYAVEVEVLEEDEEAPPRVYSLGHTPVASAVGVHSQGSGASWDAEGRICRSPQMGLAIKVNARVGQLVEAGEVLLVLEAMKMETNILAPRAGKVISLHVSPRQSVKQGQILVELE
jgi:methylmalonyl-CoA carboxyltransferase 1.3S subunit